MDKKVIGYFREGKQAEDAVNELKQKGIKEISILGNDERRGGSGGKGRGRGTGNQDLTSGTMTGGTIGGLAGLAVGTGALGALGAAALVIPGVGPILAMGPLAAALGGVVTGGIAGALVDYGIPSDQSSFYETKMKEGNTIMILKTDESKTDLAASILRNHGAQDVRVH
jgi:hypothetical protein